MTVEITPAYLARSNSEDGHQAALFCHAQAMEKVNYRWGLLYAIPNGGYRGLQAAARMSATGVKRGFPDIGIPVPVKITDSALTAPMGFPGMFLELKRPGTQNQKQGSLATSQKYWQEILRSHGYYVQVGYGWEHAATLIEAYFNGSFA